MEEIVPSKGKTEKVNPRLIIGEKDVKNLKGKGIGEKCVLLVKGHIVEAREPSEWEKKEGKKENSYTIEIESIINYGSKRLMAKED